MNVLLVSGSPRPDNRTLRAVQAVTRLFQDAGLTTQIIDLATVDLPRRPRSADRLAVA